MTAEEIIQRAELIRDKAADGLMNERARAAIVGARFRVSMRMHRRCGSARSNGVVTLSGPIFAIAENDGRFENTVLHELAHLAAAACGERRSHGQIWQLIHIALGGNGRRCSTATPSKPYKPRPSSRYIECEKCGTSTVLGVKRLRRMRGGSKFGHRGCGGIFRETRRGQ